MSTFAKHRTLRAAVFAAFVALAPNIARAQSELKTEMKAEDFGGVMVGVYVPDDQAQINSRSQNLLRTRLAQVASSGGLSGVAMNTRFILFPRVTVLEAIKGGGLQNVVSASVEVTLVVRDVKAHSYIDQWTVTLAGTAADEASAVTQAISGLKPGTPALQQFATQVHDKIVAHYEQNCSAIRKDAMTTGQAGERSDEALAALLSVPMDAKTCHPLAMKDASKLAATTEAEACTRTLRAARQHKIDGDFAGAADHLIAIGPKSSCAAGADKLTAELEQSSAARENEKVRIKLATIRQQSIGVGVSVRDPLTGARARAVAVFNSKESRNVRLDIAR